MQTTPNNSRALAIITYITFIGWIIAFMLNNKQKHSLVTYHQKQSLGIQCIYFAIAVLSNPYRFIEPTNTFPWSIYSYHHRNFKC